MTVDNAYHYAANKLAEMAGPDLWPLAMLYFDPTTKGLKCAILPQGAELIVGHGRKIGVIMEAQARQSCKRPSTTAPGAGSRNVSRVPPKVPRPADSAESE